MLIYILLFAMILLLNKIFKKDKKRFCFYTGVLLWLLVALRNVKLGLNDTENIYYPIFLNMQFISFADILNIANYSGKLFYILTKILGTFIINYNLYLAVIGVPFIASIMYLIYKYSKYPLVSVFLFIALYYLYSFFLLRQVIAIGIVVFSYKYILEKKPIRFVLLVMLAVLFHKSAWLFIFAYPVCRYIKFGKKNYIFILIAFVVANLLPSFILNIINVFDISGTLSVYIKYGVYDTSGKISMFGLFITVAILALGHYYYVISNKNNIKKIEEAKKTNQNSEVELLVQENKKSMKEYNILLNLSTLGSIIFAFSNVVSEFYRVSLYFSVFNILLVSTALNSELSNRKKSIIVICFIVITIIYFLLRTINNINSNPYSFFWNQL